MQNHTQKCIRHTCLGLILLLWPLFAFSAKPKALVYHIRGISDASILKNTHRWLSGKDWLNPATLEQAQNVSQRMAQQIKQSLAPFGYFNAKIVPYVKASTQGGWQADYDVMLGEPSPIRAFTIQITGEGRHHPTFKHLLEQAHLQVGKVFNAATYKKLRQSLFDMALRYGFLDASLQKREVLVDKQARTVRIKLVFNTGPQYTFGAIDFHSTGKLIHDTFLKKFQSMKPGDPYHVLMIQKLKHDLGNSDLFRTISIIPGQPNKKRRVPLHVKLVPLPTYQYRMGFGYGTDTGVRGLLGTNVRHLQSRGQQIKLLGKASEHDLNFSINYITLGKNPILDQYNTELTVRHLEEINQESDSVQLSFYKHTMLWKWQYLMGLNLIDEQHRVIGQESRFGLPVTDVRALYFDLQWNRRIADDLLHPQSGQVINLALRGSLKSFLSTVSFLQSKLTIKQLFTMGKTKNRMFVKGVLGLTVIDDPFDLPTFLQFQTGGAQTVRGYAYHSIPDVTKPGRILKEISVEYQQHLYRKFYAGVFMDAGCVSRGIGGNIKRGVGVSLIWLSPVGSLKLSLANALDKPDKPWLLQFSMGPDL